ncbi:MAG TPA: metal transporter [Flavobacteriaceae bacterium]|nr:metal transporter [Flavobacteriaceae bacterium]
MMQMKYTISLTVSLLTCMVALGQEVPSKNEMTEFTVNGNCEMCKKRIEAAALNIKGVKMVRWDIPTRVLNVVYNAKKLNIESIHQAVAAAGHDTPIATAPDSVYAALPLCCLYERNDYN